MRVSPAEHRDPGRTNPLQQCCTTPCQTFLGIPNPAQISATFRYQLSPEQGCIGPLSESYSGLSIGWLGDIKEYTLAPFTTNLRREVMRHAAFWMSITALLVLAFTWQENEFYLEKPEVWPTSSGTIVSNKVVAYENDEEQSFRLELVYRYENEGSTVEGNRIRPAEPIFSTRKKAEQVAKAFPVGKNVVVYFNPVEKSEPRSLLLWEFPDILSPVVFLIIIMLGSAVVLYLVSEYRDFRD